MPRAGLPRAPAALGVLLASASLAGLWVGRLPESPSLAPSQGGGEGGSSPSAPKTSRALLTVLREGEAEDPPSASAAAASSWWPVRGGVFWSGWLEARVPRGFPAAESSAWLRAARGSAVVALERGGCGRASNRRARLSGGGRACVRYGINPEQVQGEALSYHLAGLLGVQERLPPVALSRVGPQWAAVGEELRGSRWAEGAVVSLARWVDNLTEVVAPQPWRAPPDLAPSAPASPAAAPALLSPASLRGLGPAQLVELVQWSDLILFDYLTANFDRLASNLFSLQWDPAVMTRATRNLHRAPDGGLVFLDNEAGLGHGYRLLAVWDRYNEPLLRSVCVFRQRTAARVRELHRRRSAAAELRRLYRAREPLAESLGFLSPQQARLLQERVDLVHRHILHCKARAAQEAHAAR